MIDLTIIEHHPRRVLEAFRRGEFDQIEILGQADEKEFFELCFQEKILEALAKNMPNARKKKEVPPLIYFGRPTQSEVAPGKFLSGF